LVQWGYERLITKEREMYPTLKEHFETKGYSVIVDEFSLLNPEMTADVVDVVAADWGQANLLDAIAVECKLESEAKISALSSIRQALEYQICFPKVYVATQDGDIAHVKNFFEQNGIGHMTISLTSNDVTEQLPPKRGTLYDESIFNLNIKDRLIMLLVFKDVFGIGNYRFGEMNTHGWVAKEFQNSVQLNCFFDLSDGSAYSGLNLERKQGFWRMHEKLKTTEFLQYLKVLTGDYQVGACIDLWPSQKCETIFPDRQANRITMNDLESLAQEIKEVLIRKKPTERPHLWITHKVWNNKQCLSRDTYTKIIQSTLNDLDPILNYLG